MCTHDIIEENGNLVSNPKIKSGSMSSCGRGGQGVGYEVGSEKWKGLD